MHGAYYDLKRFPQTLNSTSKFAKVPNQSEYAVSVECVLKSNDNHLETLIVQINGVRNTTKFIPSLTNMIIK